MARKWIAWGVLGVLLVLCAPVAGVGAEEDRRLSISLLLKTSILTSSGNRAIQDGNYRKAKDNFEKVFNLYVKELGKEHLDTLTAMNNLAASYGYLGEYNKSIELFETVLKVKKTKLKADDPSILFSMSNLASAYADIGAYTQAIAMQEITLESKRRVLGAEDPDTLLSMHDLAKFYTAVGDTKKAIRLHKTTLGIREKKFGTEDRDTLASMSALASAYSANGDYVEAINLLDRTIELSKKVLKIENPDIQLAINNLALIYLDFGEYTNAARLFEQVWEISKNTLGVDHPETLTTANNLALAYSHLGEHQKALLLNEATLEAREKKLGSDHPATLNSMHNIAANYIELGDLAKAHSLQEIIFEKSKLVHGYEHVATLKALNNLVATEAQLGNPLKGYILTKQAILSVETVFPKNHPISFELYANLTGLLLQMKQTPPALFYARLAIDNANQHKFKQKDLPQVLRVSIRSDHVSIYELLAETLLDIGRIDEAITTLQWLKLDEAQRHIENQNTPAMQASAASQQDKVLTELDRFVDQYNTINDKRREIHRNLQPLLDDEKRGKNSDATQIKRLKAELAAQNKKLEDFLNDIPAKAEKAIQTKTTVPFSTMQQFKELLNKSGANAAVLHIFPAENALWLILTTPDASTPTAVKVGYNKADFENNVRELFLLLEHKPEHGGRVNKDPIALCSYFYDTTIAKIADKLPAKNSTLVLYLYGSLRYIPPAAYYDGKNKQWLIEKYPLVVFTNASRENMGSERAPSWAVAGFAATKKVDRQNGEFLDELPYVLTSLQTIIKDADGSCAHPKKQRLQEGLLPGSCFLDDKFTTRNFYSALGGKNYQAGHVATHFKLNKIVPDQSILHLGNKEDLILSDFNRQAPNLSHIDLLVFSGCHTGPGEPAAQTGAQGAKPAVNTGDGKELESLGEYGQRKGARSVMATLWDIRDDCSALLLADFYRFREQGLNKAEALRQAQLRFISGETAPKPDPDAGRPALPEWQKTPWAHPSNWAPFILMGNWL